MKSNKAGGFSIGNRALIFLNDKVVAEWKGGERKNVLSYVIKGEEYSQSVEKGENRRNNLEDKFLIGFYSIHTKLCLFLAGFRELTSF